MAQRKSQSALQRSNSPSTTKAVSPASPSQAPLLTGSLGYQAAPLSQATPETLLWLQRTVGNQSVQRLLHAPSRPAPTSPAPSVKSVSSVPQIQRYRIVGRGKDDDYETSASSEEAARMFPKNKLKSTDKDTGAKTFALEIEGADTHPELKVADDYSMAMENIAEPKALFAKPQVIQNSSTALTSAEAVFELVALPEIKLKVKEKGGTTHELLKVLPRNKTLALNNPGREGVGMKTYPMCTQVGYGMMGDKSEKFPAANIEPVLAPSSKTTIPKAIYKPEWHFHTAKALSGSKIAADEMDQEKRDQLGTDYASMEQSEWTEKSRDAGINEFALPEVGEAYAAYSVSHHDSLNFKKKWNWHYAGVVAKSLDGNDRMTLENYTRDPHFKSCKKEEQGDPNYFFQMYGNRKDQSFFRASLGTNDFVNLLVLRMRKRLEALPEQQKESFSKFLLSKGIEIEKDKEDDWNKSDEDEEDDWNKSDEEEGDKPSALELAKQKFAALNKEKGSKSEEEDDWNKSDEDEEDDWAKSDEEEDNKPSALELAKQKFAALQGTKGGGTESEEED